MVKIQHLCLIDVNWIMVSIFHSPTVALDIHMNAMALWLAERTLTPRLWVHLVMWLSSASKMVTGVTQAAIGSVCMLNLTSSTCATAMRPMFASASPALASEIRARILNAYCCMHLNDGLVCSTTKTHQIKQTCSYRDSCTVPGRDAVINIY